jgi:hypothetical protein
VISVVVLQSSMDLMNGEHVSSSEARGTSTVDGNQVTGKEAEIVSDVTEVNNEPTTIPVIKTEPTVSCARVLSVMHCSTGHIQNFLSL